ncbi:MAG: cell wall-binding repeat-containing protein [Tissierellia bacterium]|nr:cell wall-binding repeat-containing protein [Tissierellia bacterium]
MKRKVISLLLAFVLLVGIIPFGTYTAKAIESPIVDDIKKGDEKVIVKVPKEAEAIKITVTLPDKTTIDAEKNEEGNWLVGEEEIVVTDGKLEIPIDATQVEVGNIIKVSVTDNSDNKIGETEKTVKGNSEGSSDIPTNPELPAEPMEPQEPEQPGNEVEKPETDRIFGQDRIETAIKVSKQKFDQADTVIIARHDVFADALVAGPLAYALDAPILLSRPNELVTEVGAEIERLGAKNIIIVGGLGSIDENVEESLEKYVEIIERLEGPTRYETAVKVAERLKKSNGGNGYAVIATGETYPDALAVGPFAAVKGLPILLVKPNEVPEVVEEAFTNLEIEKIYIAGGEASVGKGIEKDMPTLMERFSGDDRYATAVDIAKKTNSEAKNIYLASGEVFADALVAGPAAAKENAPILLTRRNVAAQVLKIYFKELSIEKLTIIGGENTITDESVDSIFK